MEIQTFRRISEINLGAAVWNLRVFLLRVWMWMSGGSDPSIRMILSDEEGVRIHATVHGGDYQKFKTVLWFEGCWFRLRDAIVVPALSGLSVAPHKYELRFVYDTGFFPIYGDTPSGRFMLYQTLPNIFNRRIDESYPIDLLGVVSSVGELEYEWTGTKLQFTLRDKELRSIECLVYGRDAEDLAQRFYMEYDNHVFVVLRCFYVVRWRGHAWLKGQEGLSTIMYDQYANPEWYSLVNSYPDPVPEEYPDGDDKKCFVF